MLRGSGELGPKVGPLGGDAGGAGVEMTLPRHVAPDRHQHRGPEAYLLRAEQDRGENIGRRLDAAIGAKLDTRSQTIQHERLLRLGQAKLPWAASVLDRRQWRCASAAGMTADQDVVGAPLGDAGGDGADA